MHIIKKTDLISDRNWQLLNMRIMEGASNFYFKDLLAYTEDDVLIYNIFAYKIPRKITSSDAMRYFSQFGKIHNLRLVNDKKRSRRYAPRVGFINFENPMAAALVLRKTDHMVHKSTLYVKACDTWHQPLRSNVKRSIEIGENAASSETNIDPNATNILQLNDYCLEHICKYLQLKEQVAFSRVCHRFRGIFRMYSKIKFRTFTCDNLQGLTLWDTRTLLEVAGPFMQRITGMVPIKERDRITEFIMHHCKKVTNVSFEGMKLKSLTLRKLAQKMSAITHLVLQDCYLNDNSVFALRYLDKLQVLSLADNYDISGKHLNKLINVKNLHINGCGNILPNHLIEAFTALTQLAELDIRRCHRLTTEAFVEMSRRCPNLYSLKMCCTDVRYEVVAELPSLKRLDLLCLQRTTIRPELFSSLIEKKAHQLERLRIAAHNAISINQAQSISQLYKLKQLICANNRDLDDACLQKFCALTNLEDLIIKNCRSITDFGLIKLLKYCTKLKLLNVQRCSNITDDFLLKVIRLLQTVKPTPTRPLDMYVLGTAIQEPIDCPMYNEVQHLLKVIFKKQVDHGLDEEDQFEILEYLAGGDVGENYGEYSDYDESDYDFTNSDVDVDDYNSDFDYDDLDNLGVLHLSDVEDDGFDFAW